MRPYSKSSVNVHNLSVTGGAENINYRIALGLLDQESVATGNNFDRLNLESILMQAPLIK